jgi:hypothetical protein
MEQICLNNQLLQAVAAQKQDKINNLHIGVPEQSFKYSSSYHQF